MVSRPVPEDCDVVENSTPVVSFGNPTSVKVATLGINPSNIEFVENNVLLSGKDRRLSTISSLGASATESLTDSQIQEVIDDCYEYFRQDKNPYDKWFKPLDKIIQIGFDASYYADSACHLDLVHWATNSKWKDLTTATRERLLKESGPHLINQLRSENISTVVVNGAEVWNELTKLELVTYDEVKTIYFGKNKTKQTPCKLRIGHGCGATFYGWTSNIQSQHGANEEKFNEELGHWLRETIAG